MVEPNPSTTVLGVRNMSPKTVTVTGRTLTIVLPPMSDQRFDDASKWDDFDLDTLKASPYLDVDTGGKDGDDVAAVFGVAFWVAAIGLFFVVTNTNGWLPVVIWVAFCLAIGGGAWRVATTTSWTLTGRWLREKAALLLVLTIGFGIPALVLLFATQLFDQLRGDVTDAFDAPLNQVVIYRLIQVVFLGIATTFPALLYFLFDRQHVETLRCRFLLALFRLDRRLESTHDWNARYGRQVMEAFGKHRGQHSSRLLRARRSPVVVATIVIALGWVIAFLNLDAVSTDGTGQVLAGGSLLELFEPEQGVIAFGFLGAYFFGVNTVLRSYLRGDLRPKAYSQITTRVLIVIVLSSLVAITPLGDEQPVLVVAFFAGIVPDTVLQWIWEKTRGGGSGEHFQELEPLTKLEGIDLYDRARLAEEGVTNVESLAHGDLIDLLLQTRIPPGRLVDWVDQAVLHLHLSAPRSDPLDGLRKVGVRTATDLITVSSADRDALLTALGAADDAITSAKLTVLVLALQDAEWVEQLLAWRTNERPADVAIHAPGPEPSATDETAATEETSTTDQTAATGQQAITLVGTEGSVPDSLTRTG